VSESIVWITGATQGIGAALARHVPYAGARVINISRRRHPELETILADLTDPAAWDEVIGEVRSVLTSFRGERAIFVNNALYSAGAHFAGQLDSAEQRRQVLANVAAPLVLGDAFLCSCEPRFEAGLVMISSATARYPMEGQAVYGAAKAAMEQWVRTVRAELQRSTRPPWVIAVRPGFVATEAVWDKQKQYRERGVDYPGRAAVERALDSGAYLTPDQSAQQIWNLLPPDPKGRNVLYVGEMVEGAFVDGAD
jgi:NAD(P)-dependent dehydrogenase (short-subunit alcohol dehydrogenase family)